MIQDWVRIDGNCYGTKKFNTLTVSDDEGHKVEILGKVTLIIDYVDGDYFLIRGNRVEVMNTELYPTLALAKINMLKYMRDNSF
jgi:hypothetical protein